MYRFNVKVNPATDVGLAVNVAVASHGAVGLGLLSLGIGLQLITVVVTVILAFPTGHVIVTSSVAVHPHAFVTVNVYVPAGAFVT